MMEMKIISFSFILKRIKGEMRISESTKLITLVTCFKGKQNENKIN